MFSPLRASTLCAHTTTTTTIPTRTFTSTASLPWKSHKNALAATHENLPPYPHGRALWFKQSDRGLYGGSRLQFGNNVSPDTETKTRRTWYPNVKRKALYSLALNRRIRVRVSTRVLRTIDKVGGLDEYLLGEKSARIRQLGMEGWRLRCLVMGTRAVQERFNTQRRALGLPEVDYEALAREVARTPAELLDALPVEQQEFVVEGEEELSAEEQAVEAAMLRGSAVDAPGSREAQFHEDVEAAKQTVWRQPS